MWSSKGGQKVILGKQTLLSWNLFNLNCIPLGDPISWYNLKPIFLRLCLIYSALFMILGGVKLVCCFYAYTVNYIFRIFQNRNKLILLWSVKVVTNQLILFALLTPFSEVGQSSPGLWKGCAT